MQNNHESQEKKGSKLGFANEKSDSDACLFVQILCEHLRK